MFKKITMLALCLGLATPCAASDTSWMDASKNEPIPDSSWMNSQLEKNLKAPSDGTSIGTILIWKDHQMPKSGKWMECDGRAVSASEYPEYVAKYGPATPDFRGKFLRGHGGKSGALGAVQEEQIGDHSHLVGRGSSWLGYYSGGWGGFEALSWRDGSFETSGTYKDKGAKETRPENVAVKFIIKVK